jgi:hypothetical protein
MSELKSYIVMVVGAVFTLLAPIQNFMIAMALLFGVNFGFGLMAAIVNREGWSWKKACWFFWLCFMFFGTACSLFLIGHFMGEKEQAATVVKGLCFLAIYVFGTNICRNWRNILTPGTAWYKFVDLMYYVLSVKFVEKFNIVKKWQEERNNEDRAGEKVEA